MSISEDADIRNVPIKHIIPNPNNPRLIFDQEKMDKLTASIIERGILVPLNVFIGENKKFIIIDGERRHKAALQLGLTKLPVIITDRPDESDYVKDMFHIHHMREQWQLVPTALELGKVAKQYKKQNKKDPTEKELSTVTGLTISEVRRCKTVLSFPTEIQDLMLEEEAKTKKEKSEIGKEKILTEDFFIEIAKNIVKPLEENNKKIFENSGGKEKIYQSLVNKRRKGNIKNIVSLRPVSKYVREHPRKAGKELKKFIENDEYNAEKLIHHVNLDFDPYKFERNVNVFLGAIEKIPKRVDEKHKRDILRILRRVKKTIDEQIRLLGK
jgi:ParB/RepB/Spo0J family partition protein